MKFIAAMLFLLAGDLLFADPGFTIDPRGNFQADSLIFKPVCYNEKWSPVYRMTPEQGFPNPSGNSTAWRGHMSLGGADIFAVRQTLSLSGDTEAAYEISWSAVRPVTSKAIGLEVLLPVTQVVTVNGEPFSFHPEYQPARQQFYFPKKEITLGIPAMAGEVTLQGTFSCGLQDMRKYGKSELQLRIYADPGAGDLTSCRMRLRGSWRPHTSTPISLAAAANMGFADEKADDQRGGWTDQGPDNDLAMFPVGRQLFHRIPFDIVDPLDNEGRGCIVLKGKTRPYFPLSAEIFANQARGKYLYLLHAAAWPAAAGKKIGRISVEYSRAEFVDRQSEDFEVIIGREVGNFWEPLDLPNALVAWKARNPQAQIGLYLSRFDLSGESIRRIVLQSEADSVWMIAGATVSDVRVDNALTGHITLAEGEEYVAFAHQKPVLEGSILDFSTISLDAPAGKYGFLSNQNGRFEFEQRPGVAARFYGANVCFEANFAERELTDRMVDEFAKTGYNLMRLHHFDGLLRDSSSRSSLAMIPWRLDRLDYLIAACKAKGIYLSIDVYTCRELTENEQIPGRKLTNSEYKALIFLDEAVRNHFKRYMRGFLEHVNPYTNLMWKDDPAIAMISLVNEDTIFHTSGSSAFVRKRFEQEFTRRYPEADASRPELWRQFLGEVYAEGFRDLRQFCEETGVRAPITDQNFWSNLATTVLRQQYDYVDNHFYWKHPVFLDQNWKLPMRISSDSAVRNFAGGVSGMSLTRILGKPFSVSEWNYVYPNPHAPEGAFLMGAYAAAQDWSSLCRFAWTHGIGRIRQEQSLLQPFDLANDPVRSLSERAGVLFFLRGDVTPSQQCYPVEIPATIGERDQYPAILHRLMLLGKTGTVIAGTPSSPMKNTGEIIRLEEEEAVRNTAKTLRLNRQAPFVNDTGELELNSESGIFIVKTPQSEGFVIPPALPAQGNFATVSESTHPAAVLVAAMDGYPLAESERILLLHLTETQNSGIRFRDPDRTIVEDWGKLPLLLKRNTLTVILEKEFTGYTLYAIDVDGRRLRELPFIIENGKTRLQLGNTHDDLVFVACELVR